MPASWVIHTVGPVWHGGKQGEPDLLRACYENAFRLATEKGVKRIAFPAISTGAYGYPKEPATELALESMRRHLDAFDEIVACCFSPADAEFYGAKCPECLRS